MKSLLRSMCYTLFMCICGITTVFALSKSCDSAQHYCIDIQVKKTFDNRHKDLCYKVQLNGSDQVARGSVALDDLPAVLFSISKQLTSYGKPFEFKIINAYYAPPGQCAIQEAKLQPVKNCNLMEFSAVAGTVRSITLTESNDQTFFTCQIK